MHLEYRLFLFLYLYYILILLITTTTIIIIIIQKGTRCTHIVLKEVTHNLLHLQLGVCNNLLRTSQLLECYLTKALQPIQLFSW